MSSEKRRFRWAPLLLFIIPVWLILSATVGIWLLFRHEKKQAEIEQERFSQAVSSDLIADDLKKLVTVLGERNTSSDSAAATLTRTASMIEGLLGPSNIGYPVKRHRGPASWPILQVTIKGTSAENPVWVIASYDSRPGSPGADANASGVSAAIAAAQALAAEKPVKPIHFAFIPHANDPESPVLETADELIKLLRENKPSAILVVEAMGSGESLWLTSRDTEATPLSKIDGLGKVVGAEVACLGEDSDLASVLFEMNQPAVRVATRAIVTPGEPDNREPFAPTVAASTGRLIELIHRLAR
ncbi:MAG TPA: M28 family peptidase [Luteolibacter sp.]|nr:M28 family peptidase [Luteolibacter sp.]